MSWITHKGTNCLGVKLNMPETIISTSGSVVWYELNMSSATVWTLTATIQLEIDILFCQIEFDIKSIQEFINNKCSTY